MWNALFWEEDLLSTLNNLLARAAGDYEKEWSTWQGMIDIEAVKVLAQLRPVVTSEYTIPTWADNVRRVVLLSEYGSWAMEWLRQGPIVLFGVSLIGCALVFALPRLPPAAIAFCYSSLLINAYYAGHALAQVALPRYAAVVQHVGILILILALAIAVRSAWYVGSPMWATLKRRWQFGIAAHSHVR
jgi:hypothetical protein